eukprot:Polyplicarium_translucidae@DN2788_c0_g1_i1.p1
MRERNSSRRPKAPIAVVSPLLPAFLPVVAGVAPGSSCAAHVDVGELAPFECLMRIEAQHVGELVAATPYPISGLPPSGAFDPSSSRGPFGSLQGPSANVRRTKEYRGQTMNPQELYDATQRMWMQKYYERYYGPDVSVQWRFDNTLTLVRSPKGSFPTYQDVVDRHEAAQAHPIGGLRAPLMQFPVLPGEAEHVEYSSHEAALDVAKRQREEETRVGGRQLVRASPERPSHVPFHPWVRSLPPSRLQRLARMPKLIIFDLDGLMWDGLLEKADGPPFFMGRERPVMLHGDTLPIVRWLRAVGVPFAFTGRCPEEAASFLLQSYTPTPRGSSLFALSSANCIRPSAGTGERIKAILNSTGAEPADTLHVAARVRGGGMVGVFKSVAGGALTWSRLAEALEAFARPTGTSL